VGTNKRLSDNVRLPINYGKETRDINKETTRDIKKETSGIKMICDIFGGSTRKKTSTTLHNV
jgi:hypothetical protein